MLASQTNSVGCDLKCGLVSWHTKMDASSKYSNFFKQNKSLHTAVINAVDYAICNGMIMRTKMKPTSSEVIQHAPFTLFPSLVPRELYEQAISVQKDFNFLMHTISKDEDFMKSAFASVLENDEFTRNLFRIYTTVSSEKPKKTELAIIRSDYMFHQPDESAPTLKQIEINMIASSFGGIGTEKANSLHCSTLRQAGFEEMGASLPVNDALSNLAQAIIKAWEIYGNDSAGVIFIVTEKENNVFDQRTLELKIYELQPKIFIRRCMLSDVAENGYVDVDGKLFIDSQEIAVVYYRAGYSPNDYPTQKEWDARLLLDGSNAINCPSAAHQLVGAKKIQQILAKPKVLERFIKDKNALKRIKDTFAGFYGLEMGPDGDSAIEKVLENPKGYVLKPQLEGGGNNLYNEELVEKLSEVQHDSRRCAYIVMEKIIPMPVNTLIVRAEAGYKQMKPVEGVSELGIYGVVIANGDKLVQNTVAGHLLRTKASHHDDGGVASGVAVLDSPLLF